MSRTDRTGIALPTVMFALVIIGVLIAGTFFATTQEYRVARTSLTSQKALAASEYGQNQLLNDWSMAWNQSMKTGDTVKRVYTAGTGTVDSVIMTRLRFNMFSIVSTGNTGSTSSDDSRRRTGLLIRLDTPEIPFPGAFSGALSIGVSGSFQASGNDSIPAGWTDCPPAGATRAAIASTASSNVTVPSTGTCAAGSCLTGTPKVLSDPSVADTTKVLDGWASLVAGANVVLNAATITGGIGGTPTYNADGSCKTTDAMNWGDPARAATPGKCESYFPVIYLKSAITGALGPTTILNGGVGQGILLVDANIKLNGNFTWVGPIIVRGNVTMSGTGNKTVGGIQALNQGCLSSCNSLSGTSNASYSSCTISKRRGTVRTSPRA